MKIPLPLYIKEPLAVFLKKLSFESVPVAWYQAATVFAKDYGLPQEKSAEIHKKYHHHLRQWLLRRYGYITEGEIPTEVIEPGEQKPIWVFWWQGMEHAPELVQLCLKSVKHNCGDHPVIVISQDNYQNYVTLPDHILQKREAGKISLTHFSDIVRMNLLADHGGLWLDATIFASRSIPEYWFTEPMYTGRNPGGDYTNASDWNWTSYALSTRENHPLPTRMKLFFKEYWKNENGVVDYFMMDCAMDMIVRKCPEIRDQIHAIPNNNTRQHDLDAMFYSPYEQDPYENLLESSDTYFHKLTWKAAYPERTEDGKETAYSYWRR